MTLIVIHYGEIGLKGKNRIFFEKRLMHNIRSLLKPYIKRIYRRYGRIVCEVENKGVSRGELKSLLERLPGIEYFSFAEKTPLDIESVKETALKLLKNSSFSTFKVETKRSYKKFPMKSIEMNNYLGEHLRKALNKSVNLKHPDLILYLEICEKEIFLYLEKYRGVGGLPVGVGGRVVSLLSGGIDSPVASFMMMKRGCEVIFLHFYNKAINPPTSLSKIKKIVANLTKYQLRSRLYLVPFGDIQLEIIKNIPVRYRMIVYRRFMMRLANIMARMLGAGAVVTGDSLGQVASQTLENLNCIYKVSEIPVLAPLIGMSKSEIIEIAKKIGTYEYSIMPYQDCCSFMIAPHPSTKTDPRMIERLELNLRIEGLMERAVERALGIEFEFQADGASSRILNN